MYASYSYGPIHVRRSPTCNCSYCCRQLQISNYFTKTTTKSNGTQNPEYFFFASRCHCHFLSISIRENSNKSIHKECLSALSFMRNWFHRKKFFHSKAKNSINIFFFSCRKVNIHAKNNGHVFRMWKRDDWRKLFACFAIICTKKESAGVEKKMVNATKSHSQKIKRSRIFK